MNFKEKLDNYIIPFIEDLIEKERAHLQYLKDQKEKIPYEYIHTYIGNSEIILEHYKIRLKEYIEHLSRL